MPELDSWLCLRECSSWALVLLIVFSILEQARYESKHGSNIFPECSFLCSKLETFYTGLVRN